MTQATLIRPAAYRRLSAGHYLHLETGVEIVRGRAHSNSSHVVWNIYKPTRGMQDDRMGCGSSLKEAQRLAAGVVETVRAGIFAAWRQAHNANRAFDHVLELPREYRPDDWAQLSYTWQDAFRDRDHAEALRIDSGQPVDEQELRAELGLLDQEPLQTSVSRDSGFAAMRRFASWMYGNPVPMPDTISAQHNVFAKDEPDRDKRLAMVEDFAAANGVKPHDNNGHRYARVVLAHGRHGRAVDITYTLGVEL